MSTDTLTHPPDTQRVPLGRWRIDPTRSSVEFRARTLWGLTNVTGRFERYEGTLDLQENPAIELTIDAASINTNLGRRDRHLRSADFFDVTNHPDFTFAADSVRLAEGGVRVTGRLTVRGETRPASFDAAVSSEGDEVSLDGELPVHRGDFGLTWNFIGIASMHNTIVVHAVFTRAA